MLEKIDRGGRPSKLNAERQARICEALELGAFNKQACECGGIDESTFYSWMKTGESEEKDGAKTNFSEFSQSIKKAQLRGEFAHIENIREASKKNWTASAWFLERRYPDRWARRSKIALTDADDQGFKIEIVMPNLEENSDRSE